MAGVGDEGEMTALREALRQQAAAAEKMAAELEEERQASSSGADEALAMILRLQAEKAAARMEAEQFRRVAEEKIQHDEDSLAFLKGVVFHQEMEISSLNHRLLAVCASIDPYASAAAGDSTTVDDLPWLRRLAKNGVPSRRNASLPAVQLEELCSELNAAGTGEEGYSGKNGRPARTVSDIGEVIVVEKEWALPNGSHQPPPLPRLHRSASHRLRRAPSYSDTTPPRSARRASPEIISEEEGFISSRRDKAKKECNSDDHGSCTIAQMGADIEQINCTIHNLEAQFSRMVEASITRADAQARSLTRICAKLDAIHEQKDVQGDMVRSSPVQVKDSREEGSSSSSSKGRGYPQCDQLLMNHFIEVCATISSALIARPLVKVGASMWFFRCFLILVLALVFRKVLVN